MKRSRVTIEFTVDHDHRSQLTTVLDRLEVLKDELLAEREMHQVIGGQWRATVEEVW